MNRFLLSCLILVGTNACNDSGFVEAGPTSSGETTSAAEEMGSSAGDGEEYAVLLEGRREFVDAFVSPRGLVVVDGDGVQLLDYDGEVLADYFDRFAHYAIV